MNNSDQIAAARTRAKEKYGFFIHAGIYAAVMVLLVAINLVTYPEALWSIWPLMGWGLAVGIHFFFVFLLPDRNAVIDALTERELQRDPTGGPSDRRRRGGAADR